MVASLLKEEDLDLDWTVLVTSLTTLTPYARLITQPAAWTSHHGAEGITNSRNTTATNQTMVTRKDLSTTKALQATKSTTLRHSAPLTPVRNVRIQTRWWRSLATPPLTCWTVTVSASYLLVTLPSPGYHDTMHHLAINSHQSRGKDTAALVT